MTEAIPYLKSIVRKDAEQTNEKQYNPYSLWKVLLTLARLGDEESTKLCVTRFEMFIERGYLDTFILNWLQYMGNQESIRLFTKILNAPLQYNKVDDDIISYSNTHLAYMYLSDMIKNLPKGLPNKETVYQGLDKNHISSLREWLSSNDSNTIIINDERLD